MGKRYGSHAVCFMDRSGAVVRRLESTDTSVTFNLYKRWAQAFRNGELASEGIAAINLYAKGDHLIASTDWDKPGKS